MSHGYEQLIQLYDQGVPVEMLAQSLRMSEDEVTKVLTLHSRKFQRRVDAKQQASGNEALADEMLDILVDLARHSRVDKVRFDAARTVRDDVMGRLDRAPVERSYLDIASAITQALPDVRRRRLAMMGVQDAVEVSPASRVNGPEDSQSDA